MEITPEEEPKQYRVRIQVMPDQELLEEFLSGSFVGGPRTVYFDLDKGEFMRNEYGRAE